MEGKIWLSQHLDTAHSRTLRSCDNWIEFLDSAERWLLANGGLIDYYHPRSGDSNTYNLNDIQSFVGNKTGGKENDR